MGKIEYISIELEKANEYYTSGENLKGILIISVIKRIKINSIKLVIKGKASVYWTENTSSGNSSKSYSANENYLNHELVLIPKNSSQDIYLDFGLNSYPFDVILPPNLPTSFEHNIGNVRYSIKGIISLPWAFDKKTDKPFYVISHLNLNTIQNIRQGYNVRDEDVLCCGLCRSDSIFTEFDIFKTGFVPGEPINFKAKIDNQSSKQIKKVSVKLVQEISFHATYKTKKCVQTAAKIIYPNEISENSLEIWHNEALLIPFVCSSSNGTCSIIDVSYKLEFSFDPSGPSRKRSFSMPIIIGTIPLSNETEF